MIMCHSLNCKYFYFNEASTLLGGSCGIDPIPAKYFSSKVGRNPLMRTLVKCGTSNLLRFTLCNMVVVESLSPLNSETLHFH